MTKKDLFFSLFSENNWLQLSFSFDKPCNKNKETILNNFTEKTEQEYLHLIRNHINEGEIEGMITNSLDLIEKGKDLSSKNTGLNEDIDLFTYFTILSYVLLRDEKFLQDQSKRQDLAKKAHYIAIACYPKEVINYQKLKDLCESRKMDLDGRIEKFKEKLKRDYRKKYIKRFWTEEQKKLESKERKEDASRILDNVLLEGIVLKSKELEKFISNEQKRLVDNLTDKIFNDNLTKRCIYDPTFFLNAAAIGYEVFKNINALELCLKADDIIPNSIYTYSVIANLLEEFSDYISEEFIKFKDSERDYTKKHNIQESLKCNLNILNQIKKRFMRSWISPYKIDVELLKKDPESLSELELIKRKSEAIHLANKLKWVCQIFYQKIAEEEPIPKVFKRKRQDINKNEVYEIENPFLNGILILKKSKSGSNLESEKKVIDHYKRLHPNLEMLLYFVEKEQRPIEEKRKIFEFFKNKWTLTLAEVIDFKTDGNEQYLLLKRKKGLNFLEYLEISKEIQGVITHTKDYKESLNKSLKILYKHPNDFGYLKYIIQNASSREESYKDRLLEVIKIDTFVNFEHCIEALVKLNIKIPTDLIKKEFTKEDYKEGILSVISRFEKDLNKKFSEQFKDQLLKDYDVINSVLSSAQKALYKDSYLKNWIIDDSRLLNKKTEDTNWDPKVILIDFERCAIAPVQIDLAFLLDFGNFIEDKERDELVEYYLELINYHNKLNDISPVSNIKEFKRVFDYACVHRNLLNFRSYSRFIEEGDDSKEVKYYKKISLERSIKAIYKLISYEKDHTNELKSLCKGLEGIYHEIYR